MTFEDAVESKKTKDEIYRLIRLDEEKFKECARIICDSICPYISCFDCIMHARDCGIYLERLSGKQLIKLAEWAHIKKDKIAYLYERYGEAEK